jgi:biotin carboxylase
MDESTTIETASRRPRIWFNKHFSSLSRVIQTIRQACLPGEDFFIACSHPLAEAPVAQVADLFEIEPSEVVGADAYVDWCLDFVQRHHIDVFIPRFFAQAIVANQRRFDELGVRLLVAADAQTFALIENKGLFYQALGKDLVPLPAFRVVTGPEQFELAFQELSPGHQKICFKPTEGISGRGFRVLTVGGPHTFSPWNGKQLSIEFADALAEQCAMGKFPELMMMEFLPGQERSVDCLAQDGKLLAAVTRLKSYDGKDEYLEDNPLLEDYCRRITAKVGLNGMYNVQFMESGGVQYLLEVNARMSGGIHYSALSGVCLPYWALRLALGTAQASDIPVPRTSIRVDRASGQILP